MNDEPTLAPKAAPTAALRVLAATLRGDRLAQVVVVLGTFFVVTAPFAVPGLGRLRGFVGSSLLALAVVALRVGMERIERHEERQFWNALSVAYTIWLGADVLNLVVPDEGMPLAVSLVIDTAYGLYYTALVLAVEGKPHQPAPPLLSGRLERLLRWPAAAAFAFGLLVYFVLVPAVWDRASYESFVPYAYVYLVLDGYLAVRLFAFARRATDRRWRVLYFLFGSVMILSLLADANALAGYLGLFEVVDLSVLWRLMVTCFVVVVRSRHHPFPVDEARPEDAAALPEPRWQTLFYAFALPWIHFLGYGLGLLDEPGKTAREGLIGVWLMLIGTVAVLQYRILERAKKKLEEGNLHLSEELAWQTRARREKELLIAELEAKNAETERFAYTISHDLKTPLFTIQGFVGLLEADTVCGDRERAEADLAQIRAAARRMQMLLDDVLELLRVGKVLSTLGRVEMDEVVDEALRLAEPRISRRGVAVELARGLPAVHGDRTRLLEVVQQLVDNAVRFLGPTAEPRLEIGGAKQDGEAVFFVRDNGVGIEPRYHERIFGLFERLDADAEGTGIGLALVKRIVEHHGGRVWVVSEGRGRGATFRFTLPLDTLPRDPGGAQAGS